MINRERTEMPGSHARIKEINSSETCYRILQTYFEKQNQKYPDLDYPDNNLLNDLNPREYPELYDQAQAFIAKENNETIGILYGTKSSPDEFYIIFLFVDPDFQNGVVSAKLFHEITVRYKIIKLVALDYGGKINQSFETRVKRQESLIRYYQKLGFVIDTNSKSQTVNNINEPGAAVPMIWVKPESK